MVLRSDSWLFALWLSERLLPDCGRHQSPWWPNSLRGLVLPCRQGLTNLLAAVSNAWPAGTDATAIGEASKPRINHFRTILAGFRGLERFGSRSNSTDKLLLKFQRWKQE